MGGGGGGGGGGYTVDPAELEAAAQEWSVLSEQMSAVKSTKVPTDFGLIPDVGVNTLSGSTTSWSSGAGGEYRTISEMLQASASDYRGTEQTNTQQAKGIG